MEVLILMDLYECGNCDYTGELSTFGDTEYDGDVIGTCPRCGKNCVIIQVSSDNETKK